MFANVGRESYFVFSLLLHQRHIALSCYECSFAYTYDTKDDNLTNTCIENNLVPDISGRKQCDDDGVGGYKCVVETVVNYIPNGTKIRELYKGLFLNPFSCS